MNAINSNEKMIQKINEVLQTKKDAVVNIVNDKLIISVFSLLEKNLQNVREINFVIRDVKFLPHQSEIAHEFEINPTDVLFNAYDITEKNKLHHFSKARSMHDFIEKHVNIRKVNAGIRIGGNILIIDDDFMIQGSSSLEVSRKSSRDAFSNINFDTILNGSTDKEQILGALEIFKKIWFNEQVSVDYKNELLASLQYVYKEHAPEFLYYFTLNELFGDQIDVGVEHFERDSVRFKKTEIWNALYDFQKDCVVSAIRKLNTYGGCIIADSVGLGKTFEALAIIKYFEIGMNRVLVLTPAKLYNNWNSFRGDYKDSFLHETFNYRIMFHTDLSRYRGMSRSGQDLKKFDWGLYDLVVIDEYTRQPKKPVLQYLSFTQIKNKQNKVELYRECFYKAYILKNDGAYAKAETVLNSNIWYDPDKTARIASKYTELVKQRNNLKKAVTNVEYMKVNKSIKMVLESLNSENLQ